MHDCCVSSHPGWVVMVAMNAEDRNRDVQVFILIVHPGEPTTHNTAVKIHSKQIPYWYIL